MEIIFWYILGIITWPLFVLIYFDLIKPRLFYHTGIKKIENKDDLLNSMKILMHYGHLPEITPWQKFKKEWEFIKSQTRPDYRKKVKKGSGYTWETKNS